MVPQAHLSDRERQDLARYVLSFSASRGTSSPPRRLALPPPPATVSLERGREGYVRGGCVRCHGEGGRGDGPDAAALRDRRGRPLVVPDLTLVPYKQGEDAEAVAWTILAGRDGTPMPSYEGALTAERLWAVAAYVVSLQAGTKRRGMMGLVGEEVLAMPIDGEAIHAWRMGGMMGGGPMRRRRR